MEELKKQAAKITSLHVQGATNIAIFAVRQMAEFAQRNSKLPPSELWEEVKKAEKILYYSRSTEPAMKNGLAYIISRTKALIDAEGFGKIDLVETIKQKSAEYIKILNDCTDQIAKIGARRIPKGVEHFRIITHCHSSVVEAILIEAHKQGKQFEVISTETRPLYQGRITAMNLHKAGIDVTQVVDSAMRWVCKHKRIDMAIIGADAITSEGTVLNKIGSRLLALVAKENSIPFYVATQLLKYSQDTLFGNQEDIDMRKGEEIWSEICETARGCKPSGIKILNPAFESVSRFYINALITEAGIFPSGQAQSMFAEKYPGLQKGFEIIEETPVIGLAQGYHCE